MQRLPHRCAAGTLLALAALLSLAGTIGCAPPPVTLVSVSLPATERDGDWVDRRQGLVELIKARSPDVVAVQGASAVQALQLRDALPDYTLIATGAEDGVGAGDLNPILVRNGRWNISDSGHFWLSKTPYEVGSRDWDATEPRVATWVQMSRIAPPAFSLRVLSTRFDPRGTESRARAAEIVRRFAEAFGSQPVIIAGDFSTPPGGEVYHILTDDFRFANPLKDILVEQTRRGRPAEAAELAAADATRSNYVFVSLPVEVTEARTGWAAMPTQKSQLASDQRDGPRPEAAQGVLVATLRVGAVLYTLAP